MSDALKLSIIVTEESLEAATIAMYNAHRANLALLFQQVQPPWDQLDLNYRALHRMDAKAAVNAAIPHLGIHIQEEDIGTAESAGDPQNNGGQRSSLDSDQE